MRFRKVRYIGFGVALAVLSSHSRAATFVKGPFLHDVTKTSILISWETDVPTGGRIDYGTNADYGSKASSPASKNHHEVLLEGLRPATVYHYKVTAGDGAVGGSPWIYLDAKERPVQLTLVAPGNGPGQLEFLAGTEPGGVVMRGLSLRKGCGEVACRRFENGLVLMNASSVESYAFDLDAIAPDAGGLTRRRRG